MKIVPAGAKMPDHFEVIEQEKKKPEPKLTVTIVGEEVNSEPALPDDIGPVEEL